MSDFRDGDIVKMVKPYRFANEPFPHYHPGVGSVGTITKVRDDRYIESCLVMWTEIHNYIQVIGEPPIDRPGEEHGPLYIDLDCLEPLLGPPTESEVAEAIESIKAAVHA